MKLKLTIKEARMLESIVTQASLINGDVLDFYKNWSEQTLKNSNEFRTIWKYDAYACDFEYKTASKVLDSLNKKGLIKVVDNPSDNIPFIVIQEENFNLMRSIMHIVEYEVMGC